MRTSLFALAIGTFLLAGCSADDLTGLDAAPLASGATAAQSAGPIIPIEDEESSAALFSTWSGMDGSYAFDFSLRQAPGSPDIFEAPSALKFYGQGTYARVDAITTSLPCRIIEGEYSDGRVSFIIVGEDGVIAHAKGNVEDDFSSFLVQMEYADGSTESVGFKREAVGLSAAR